MEPEITTNQPTDEREERSEATDVDKIARDFPPDEPVASDDYGVTDAEEAIEEPLEERMLRYGAEQGPDEMPEAAEEAAVHTGEEPPVHADDGYLDEDDREALLRERPR